MPEEPKISHDSISNILLRRGHRFFFSKWGEVFFNRTVGGSSFINFNEVVARKDHKQDRRVLLLMYFWIFL